MWSLKRPNIGIICRWIQRKSQNGEKVIWKNNNIIGADNQSIIEHRPLAQDIVDSIFSDIKRAIAKNICNKFIPNLDGDRVKWDFCKTCSHHKLFHNNWCKS